MAYKFIFTYTIVISLLILLVPTVYAVEFQSTSYKVLDPVMNPSGFATSSNFQLWSTVGEVAVGTSSAASYTAGGGFLRFPYATLPSVSATGGDSKVALSWTQATGYLGWTVSSYSTGYATTSGGPYIFSNVGNATSSTVLPLTIGQTYYFVVTANDFFGNVVATSTQISAVPIAPSLSFNISTNLAYFGALSPSFSVYASSTNQNGSLTETEAQYMTVVTGAVNGYIMTVQGPTLSSQQNPVNVIDPMGPVNTPPNPGTKQFGMRMVATGGIGAVATAYAGSGFGYAASSTSPSQVADASTGNNATTTYSTRYVANRAALTEAGNYSTNLVYVVTARF